MSYSEALDWTARQDKEWHSGLIEDFHVHASKWDFERWRELEEPMKAGFAKANFSSVGEAGVAHSGEHNYANLRLVYVVSVFLISYFFFMAGRMSAAYLVPGVILLGVVIGFSTVTDVRKWFRT